MNQLSSNNMNADYISQHDIVQRYLKGKLTPEETVEFEEYILDKPELLEELEMDSVMLEYLPQIAIKKTTSKTISWWRTLFYCATSFAIGAILVMQFSTIQQKENMLSGSVELVEVSPLRSASSQVHPDAVYSLSNNADHIMLLLQPEYSSQKGYTVEITRLSDSASIFKDVIKPNSTGDLIVVLNKDLLKLGLMKIKIVSASSQINSTELKVLINK